MRSAMVGLSCAFNRPEWPRLSPYPNSTGCPSGRHSAAPPLRISARTQARAAEKRLRSAIGEVTERMILQPIDTELDAYRRAREGLQRALV